MGRWPAWLTLSLRSTWPGWPRAGAIHCSAEGARSASTSTCWPAGTDRPPPITGRRRAARGLGWDTETLTGVLVATVRDPAIGPRRQTQARPPAAKDTSASAGSPTHFHASTASHKGIPRLRPGHGDRVVVVASHCPTQLLESATLLVQ